MLVIDGLRVRYGPTEVLRGVRLTVRLTVPERAIVALLGGDGSVALTHLWAESAHLTRPVDA